MERSTQHHAATLTVLVENHRRFLAFLARRVGSQADAEEILQSAFVKSIEKSDLIRDDDAVVAWLYRLLRNAVIDYYRHRAVERRAFERASHWDLDTAAADPEVEQAICRCIHSLLPTLKDDYAMMIRRVDLEEASITDVASETGMTSNNTRVKLHRARKALRDQLMQSCSTCAEHACLDCDCRRPAV